VSLLAQSASTGHWALWDVSAEKQRPLPVGDEAVSAAAWSDAGDLLAVGTVKGRCLVLSMPGLEGGYELPAGKPCAELSFSPDGRWLAVGRANEVRIWDVSRRQFLGTRLELPAEVRWLVFDGRGTRLAVASAEHRVRVYLVKPDRAIHPGGLALLVGPLVHWQTAYNVHAHLPPVWVDDDQGLLTCAEQPNGNPGALQVSWMDVRTGREVRRLSPGVDRITAIVPSPDGLHVAVTGLTGCQLHDAHSGKAVGPKMLPTTWMTAAAFSPDGKSLLTSGRDQRARLWSVPDGQPLGSAIPLSNHGQAVGFLGSGLLVGQVDGLICLLQPAEPPLPFRDHTLPAPPAGQADFTRFLKVQGRFLLVREGDGARVVDLKSGKWAGPRLELADPVFQGAFLPHGTAVVVQTGKTVRAWDWRTGRTVWGPLQLPSAGYAVDTSPDARLVVSMCADRGLLLEAGSGKTLAEFVHKGDADLINGWPAARFSPDGTCFVSFLGWTTVTVWDSRTARPRFPPLRHGDQATMIAFSADSRYLATACRDHTTRVFDLATGRELARPAHPEWVFQLEFSADGRRLLTAARDGSARLWDWRAGKMVCPPLSEGQDMRGACFLPGTPWLATQSTTGVRVWDSVQGKPITPPLPPRLAGRNLCVARQARRLVDFGNGSWVRDFDLSALEGDARPRPASPEQMGLLAEVQSGFRIHQGGGLARLTTAEWLERWRRWRAGQPRGPLRRWTPSAVPAFHTPAPASW
jgi:WD40 repeat protein